MRDLRLPLPGSVIAFSPWLDMALRGATLETNSATDALVGRGLLEAMVGMFLGGKTDPRIRWPTLRGRFSLSAALHQRGGLRDVVQLPKRSTPRPGCRVNTILRSCRACSTSFRRSLAVHPKRTRRCNASPVGTARSNFRRPDPAQVPAGDLLFSNSHDYRSASGLHRLPRWRNTI